MMINAAIFCPNVDKWGHRKSQYVWWSDWYLVVRVLFINLVNVSLLKYVTRSLFDPGVLLFPDGGPGGGGGGGSGGGSHEGLFENNQLMRRDNSHGADQRAQAAAAKARALAMWPRLHHPQCPRTRITLLPSSSCWFEPLIIYLLTCRPVSFIQLWFNTSAGYLVSPTCYLQHVSTLFYLLIFILCVRLESHWLRISWAKHRLTVESTHWCFRLRSPDKTQVCTQKDIWAFSTKHWSGEFHVRDRPDQKFFSWFRFFRSLRRVL